MSEQEIIQEDAVGEENTAYCQECSIPLKRRSSSRSGTVELDPCVGLHPCGCVFCTHCFIQYLAKTLCEGKAADGYGENHIHCPSCLEPLQSHILLRQRRVQASVSKKTSVWTSWQYDYALNETTKAVLIPRIKKRRAADERSTGNRSKRTKISQEDHPDATTQANNPIAEMLLPYQKPTTVSFKQRLPQYLQVRNQYAHFDSFPPPNYRETTQYRGLLQWVESIRYGQRRIRQADKCELNDINFDWKIPEVPFEERVAQIQKYKEWHPDKDINTDLTVDNVEFPSLALWLWDLRSNRRNTKGSLRSLSFGEWTQLKDIGVRLEGSGGKNRTFEERLQELKTHKENLGHCRVRSDYNGSSALCDWVKNLRRYRKQGTLSQHQIKQLDDLDFEWGSSRDRWNQYWNAQLAKLKEYKVKHGNMRVPWQWKEDRTFAEWCHTQRKEYKKGTMRKDRQQKLEDLGFEWDLKRRTKEAQEHHNHEESSSATDVDENTAAQLDSHTQAELDGFFPKGGFI